MERIFHPIGHGAFYTERFYEDDNDAPLFTAVYDCGSFSYGNLKTLLIQPLRKEIRSIYCLFRISILTILVWFSILKVDVILIISSCLS